MSILTDLFRTEGVSWDGGTRAQLTDAVKRFAQQSGGIRALSREIGVPLTSLNRGIASGFSGSRTSTLDRLQGAVVNAGIYFTDQRKYSTALDFAAYKPGTIRIQDIQRPREAAGMPQTMIVVGRNFAGYEAVLTRQTPDLPLGGRTPDEVIAMSGIEPGDIERVIFSW